MDMFWHFERIFLWKIFSARVFSFYKQNAVKKKFLKVPFKSGNRVHRKVKGRED